MSLVPASSHGGGGSQPSTLAREAFGTGNPFGYTALNSGGEGSLPWTRYDLVTFAPIASVIFDLTVPTAPVVNEAGIYAFWSSCEAPSTDAEAGKVLRCGLDLNQYEPPNFDQPYVYSYASIPLDPNGTTDPLATVISATWYLAAGAVVDLTIQNHTGGVKHVYGGTFVQRIA